MMVRTQKFTRNYSLQVGLKDGSFLTIEPPFTLELDVKRDILFSANYCKVRIYNLGIKKREAIYFNQSDYPGRYFQLMILKAGYGEAGAGNENLTEIFRGNINKAYSVREGNNFITSIESMDSSQSYTNDYVEKLDFPAGTEFDVIIAKVMGTLSNVTIGAIGHFEGKIGRRLIYTGNPYTILAQLTGNSFFIDRGKAYALKIKDFIPDTSPQLVPFTTIDASTGLLNTPLLEGQIISLEMLFEPTIQPGRQVRVISSTYPKINGDYKVNLVAHRGIISPAVCGSLITVCDFYNNKEGIPASVAFATRFIA